MGDAQTPVQGQAVSFDQLMGTDTSAAIATENNAQPVNAIDSAMAVTPKADDKVNNSYNAQIFNDYIAELSGQPGMSPQAKQTLIETKAQELGLSNEDIARKSTEITLADDINSLYDQIVKPEAPATPEVPAPKAIDLEGGEDGEVTAEEIQQVVEYIEVLKQNEDAARAETEAAKVEVQNSKLELSQKNRIIENLENKLNEKLIEISNLKYDNVQDPEEGNIIKLYRSYKDSPKDSTADAIVLYHGEYLEKITGGKISSGELFNMYKKTNTQPQTNGQRFNQGAPAQVPMNTPFNQNGLNNLMNA